MITSALKTFGTIYAILILGELIPFQGQPLSHHAVRSLQWTVQTIKTSSYFQGGIEKASELGKQVRILFVGASAAPVTQPPAEAAALAQTSRSSEDLGSRDQRQLRALLREKK